MRADAHQHAQVAHLLAPLLDRVHLAGLVGFVHHLALPVQRQGLQRLHQHGRLHAGRDLDDQVHLAALGLKARQILRRAVHVHVVERVDAVAIGTGA